MKRASLIDASGCEYTEWLPRLLQYQFYLFKEVMIMLKVMIYRRKNIPFQKTPTILIQNKKQVIGGTGNTHTWKDGSLFPTTALQAPFYGVFINGIFAPLIDISTLTFSPSVDSTVDLSKIDCEVKPYIPRITDNWYPWKQETQGVQKELSWIAGEDGCRILYGNTIGTTPEDYPGFDVIPAGTDLSTYELPLIVPTYDFYIARRRYADGSYYDMKNVYDDLTDGKAKYSFKAKTNQAKGNNGFVGSFGNENINAYYNRDEIWNDFMCASTSRQFGVEYYGTQNKFSVQGTIAKSPSSETSWSGKQTVTGMYCNALSQYMQPDYRILPGFVYSSKTIFTRPGMGDFTDYCYTPIWVLKSLEVKKGPVTG